MDKHHWHYFLSLEEELEHTTKFVEPAVTNFKTHSITFAKLILATCSEIDVVAKMLCHDIDSKRNPKSIDRYQKIILKQFPKFATNQVSIPRYQLALKPWKVWDQSKTPDWWISHNNIKHQRNLYFQDANLENALTSLSALFILLLYGYHDNFWGPDVDPYPKLLHTTQQPQVTTMGFYILPDPALFKNDEPSATDRGKSIPPKPL